MDPNRLTQKSQEALQTAQTKALRYGHQEVDTLHLLLALSEQSDGLLPRLLERLEIQNSTLKNSVEETLEKRPRVHISGQEAGKIYVTQALQQLFVAAEDEAKRLKDEYVSVEHLVLGMLEDKKSDAGKVLSDLGMNRERLLEVLTSVRGAQRVTSTTPEGLVRSARKVRRRSGRTSAQRQARSGDRSRL